MTVANNQVMAGRRSKAPVLLAAVVSNLGAFGEETMKLIEWVTSAYKENLKRDFPDGRADGRSYESLNAEFRRDYWTAIGTVIARGVADKFLHSGLPTTRRYTI